MHDKLISVVFLLHNTLLMLISLGFLTALMLFRRPQAGIDERFSMEEKEALIWSNVAATAVAIGNVVIGYIAIKKEKLVCYYVYMALCVLAIAAPLALMELIFQDGVEIEEEEEAASLITIVVNAFACTFFGSNFICFYNGFSMQYALRTQISRIAILDKSTTTNRSDEGRSNLEGETEDVSPNVDSVSIQFNKTQGQLKNAIMTGT